MPTVEWTNARGIKMVKHYTYDSDGVSKANAHVQRLKDQGLKGKVSHKTGPGYKSLGGAKAKRAGSGPAGGPFPPHTRTYKPHPSKVKKGRKAY